MLKKREMARMAGMAGTRCDAMRCEGQKVIWTGSWRGFWRQRSPGRSGRKDCRKARQRRQSFSFEFVRFLLGRSRARVPDVTAMMSSARRLGSLVAPNPVLTLIFWTIGNLRIDQPESTYLALPSCRTRTSPA